MASKMKMNVNARFSFYRILSYDSLEFSCAIAITTIFEMIQAMMSGSKPLSLRILKKKARSLFWGLN